MGRLARACTVGHGVGAAIGRQRPIHVSLLLRPATLVLVCLVAKTWRYWPAFAAGLPNGVPSPGAINGEKASLVLSRAAELVRSGSAFLEEGDIDAALMKYVKAHSLLEKKGLLETMQGAGLLSKLGDVEVRLGRFRRAVEHYSAAREVLQGEGSMKTRRGATLLTKLGKARASEDPAKAAADLEAAREALEAIGSMNSVEGASLLGWLGDTRRRQGGDPACRSALKAYAAARRIFESLGTDAKETIGLYDGCGDAHLALGNITAALSEYGIAVELLEARGGLTTKLGADLLTKIANAHVKNGDKDAAVEQLTAARDIMEELNELETTPIGVRIIQNLGILQARQGNNAEAIEALEVALHSLERAGKLQTKEGVRLLSEMGMAHTAEGNYEESLPYLQSARSILEKNRALATKEGAGLLAELATNLARVNKPGKALKVLESARDILKKISGPSHLYLQTPDGQRLQRTIADLEAQLGLKPGHHERKRAAGQQARKEKEEASKEKTERFLRFRRRFGVVGGAAKRAPKQTSGREGLGAGFPGRPLQREH